MYANANGDVVLDNQQYIAIDGTQYPANFPKGDITELTLVTEVAKPTDPTLQITGFTVDGSYVQVWTTVAKTVEEIAFDLALAKTNKTLGLYGSYVTNREADISFTASDASVKDYQTGAQSTYALQGMLDTYLTTTPAGFYWVAKDNTKVPFTRTDLVDLAFAVGDRANTYFQHLQDKKDAVLAATTIAAVTAITW